MLMLLPGNWSWLNLGFQSLGDAGDAGDGCFFGTQSFSFFVPERSLVFTLT